MSVRSDTARPTAVVVGGGLAGITAALRLAEADHRVTLVEGRPRLGGLAFSFQRGELTVDNGQHVFLRCCTAYRGLVDRLGAGRLVDVQPRLDVPVLAGHQEG
ncbi:FAD-dependent oxidoreductase, partial [Kitasatospora indigofera]|uniref:FAD-dependent oxidoreductase n=1 Tax=Kitasatospora indigofera TaxID=67307 RepID=UPI00367D507D